jgi:cyclophilin family peptidyl-prolyl cis-trans isomerase
MRPAASPILLAVLLASLAAAGCLGPSAAPATSSTVPPASGRVERPAIELATDAGAITVLLYPEAAPHTVALMQQYVQEGYYVGRTFTRTVPGHVIQVSDAAGGATDDARRVPLETNASFHFSAGAAGIARDVDPGSGGPEFFLMDYATSHLDGNYTVWGQVVAGLEVVHDIATRPALDSSTVPSLGAPVGLPFDRMAVVPVRITAARLVTLSLPAATWAHYPFEVARNARVGDLRHSLEWPADLHAGSASLLTWYARPYGSASAPALVEVRDESGPLPLGAARAGIYHFSWTPPTAGAHTLALWVDGKPVASLAVPVRPAQGSGAAPLG